jgi:hypothetical protein
VAQVAAAALSNPILASHTHKSATEWVANLFLIRLAHQVPAEDVRVARVAALLELAVAVERARGCGRGDGIAADAGRGGDFGDAAELGGDEGREGEEEEGFEGGHFGCGR